MDPSALLKEARRRSGLTQAQLADAAGTSQPTLAAYESGAKSPSVRTLDRIVRASGATLDVTIRANPRAEGALLTALRAHAQEIRLVAEQYGIRNIRVFGSAARGEESSTSDIDLLVDFNATKHGVLPLAGFAEKVREIMGRKIDVTTAQLLREEVLDSALNDAVRL